ncbi:IS30 family transposase [Mycobacterium kubicae]|nr:IS30 family transposase [Mycobacterium kubicae]
MTRQWQGLSARRRFWELVAAGWSSEDAGVAVGVSGSCGWRWFCRFGGVNPQLQEPQGRKRPRLSPEEREQIMIGTSRGESIRLIAHRLKRAPSTVMREIDRNGAARGLTGRYRAKYRFGARQCGWDATSGYSARIAQRRSEERARRPKAGKLARCPQLAGKVQALLTKKYSPEQIAGELAKTYPDSPEMHVSHETIYRALYVQGRGELRRDLVTCLRTGRALRRPRKRARAGDGRSRIPGMVNISERPAEAADRAVPGHWEGDLIIGKNQASQIGTLVERSTGFVQLLHLPASRQADVVAEAMIAKIQVLPRDLWKTLTWDQGHEMAAHGRISLAADLDIYFCDPHSPWQRGSNENTNGLLRQYFPKGTDLSIHSAAHLDEVAAQLNNRPRKRFDWDSPAKMLDRLLSSASTATVASKP